MLVFNKNKVVLLILDDLSSKSLVESVNQVAMDNNKKDIHLILTSTNIQMNESVMQQVDSKTNNIHVFIHPSNRKIEKHLVMIQHITKYPEYNYRYFDLQGNLIENNVAALASHGISSLRRQSNQPVIKIKAKQFINEVVKNNGVNLLRSLFIKKVA